MLCGYPSIMQRSELHILTLDTAREMADKRQCVLSGFATYNRRFVDTKDCECMRLA